jgi:Fe-S cluster biogenesis protein NfuA
MLPEPIESALAEIAARFRQAGIKYQVGGSVMLRSAGLDVAVGDIDIVVAADSRRAVMEIFAGRRIEEPARAEPWRTRWFIRTDWSTEMGEAQVDVMGGLAIVVDGEVARLPLEDGSVIDIGGLDVPVAPLAHWYHIYRAHDPRKAALLASLLTDAEILAAANDLQIAHIFSPTLIVRIGNGSTANEIETTMSNDVQSSIIEVASPTDPTFDEPGTEIIDMAVLDETLEYIRPALQADGGDLVLLGTDGGKVTLQMVGACGGCPLSTMTLTAGIERILQDRVPGVTEVVAL